MKVLLVEDESGIRLLLRKIIEKNKEFQVVGETDNLTQAVTLFHRTKPDVVFLDIEISGASGLDCARIIADINPKTKIIFATAHAEYMSNAFEVYAFDYLLKPFNVERVDQTLQRILDLARQKEAEPLERIVKYEKGLDKLLVKGRESMSFVDIKDIILVQREEGSTVIYTAKDSFTTSAGLGEIEEKLDPEQFMRSHKSYIINVSQIRKIEPYGRWTYIVTFKDLKQDALITQEKYEEIKECFPKQRKPAKISNLEVLNAVLYVVENGCKWRRLPKEYGDWHVIYVRVNRWVKKGVLQEAFAHLQQLGMIQIQVNVVSLDSTCIKVHPDGMG